MGMLVVILVLVLGVVSVALYGEIHWRTGTRALRARIESARIAIDPACCDRREIETLPAPVQRYFLAVLREGQPIVAAVDLEHSGTFNSSGTAEQWKPFTSRQRVVTRRPGFDWDGRIAMMPGLSMRVHDAYVAGEGILHAAVQGLFSIANVRGTGDMARGEMMRFLAEAAWYPTALLPSQGIVWEHVDEYAARATLRDGDIAVTLLFHFDEDGLIDTVRADARGRTIAGVVVPTPWHCRLWSYAIWEGMRVPLEAEAAWVMPEATKPYFRGRITGLRYQFAR
jgi:hypothetical protein